MEDVNKRVNNAVASADSTLRTVSILSVAVDER